MIVSIQRAGKDNDGDWKLRYSNGPLGPVYLVTTVCIMGDKTLKQALTEGAMIAKDIFAEMLVFNNKQGII